MTEALDYDTIFTPAPIFLKKICVDGLLVAMKAPAAQCLPIDKYISPIEVQ